MSEIVVVHGYVGSGKSTQCTMLASTGLDGISVQHISAGNRLRNIRTGVQASEFSDFINDPGAPSPLPDWVVAGTIFEIIDRGNASMSLVDGYPRHPQAVESFCTTASSRRHTLLGTIAMQLTIDASVERIAQRGKRDGERVEAANIRDFARHRYLKDLQTTNHAIDKLGKIAPVRFVDAEQDISVVHARFMEAVRSLR